MVWVFWRESEAINGWASVLESGDLNSRILFIRCLISYLDPMYSKEREVPKTVRQCQ
jgi:hypothetical protein